MIEKYTCMNVSSFIILIMPNGWAQMLSDNASHCMGKHFTPVSRSCKLQLACDM